MSKPFDMGLFLAGVLTGANVTRQRHIRQARFIHAVIADRWHIDNPWAWQKKHLIWLMDHHLKALAPSTRYYYLLSVRLLTLRLGRTWKFTVK